MEKRLSAKKIITVIAMVGILGATGLSFAQSGGGYGYQRGGEHMGGEGCPGQPKRGPGKGCPAGLSEDDAAKFEEMRQAFRESTRPLRENLYEKELALRGEMAKKTPDAGSASGLQKEISNLRAALDAQRLTHRIELKKAFPDAEFGRGDGRGKGFHHRRAHGYGSEGCRQ